MGATKPQTLRNTEGTSGSFQHEAGSTRGSRGDSANVTGTSSTGTTEREFANNEGLNKTQLNPRKFTNSTPRTTDSRRQEKTLRKVIGAGTARAGPKALNESKAPRVAESILSPRPAKAAVSLTLGTVSSPNLKVVN